MKGKFDISFIGKSLKPSKEKGSIKYLFVQGDLDPATKAFNDPSVVEFWSTDDYDVKVGQAYEAQLDIQGDYVKFIKFTSPVKINNKPVTA